MTALPTDPAAPHDPAQTDLVVIGSRDGLAAAINPLGAELWWLRDGAGNDLQWDGDARVWNGRAPILFPFVGTLRDGHYRAEGAEHAMARHGFARRMLFEVVAHTTTSASFRLAADAATRGAYPFEFALILTFTVDGNALTVAARIENPGDAPLPASFGFHPALRWPLVAGAPRAGHTITFDADEPQPIHRLDAAGLLAGARPSPIVDRVLDLHDDLFTDDAILLLGLNSRGVIYGAPTGPQIRVTFENLPDLGIWTKPGGGYICIEPWHGYSDPAGFTGDVFDKPGIIAIAAGGVWEGQMTIALEPGG